MVSAYINILFIFVLMFIGYLLTYKQWFSNQIGDAFSKLVLQIALPCNMFLTITKNFSRSEFLHRWRNGDPSDFHAADLRHQLCLSPFFSNYIYS